MQPPAVDNAAKAEVWRQYEQRRPGRVPVRLSSNPRVFLAEPDWNTEGFTFEQAAHDPEIHVKVALGWALFARMVLNKYTDSPVGLPERWQIGLHLYNTYEAAFFGAPIQYQPGQVPCTEPMLDESGKRDILDFDVDHPLDNPYLKERLAFWREMERVCDGLRFEGRPVELSPLAPIGTDGPVTVACNLRGSDFLMDLAADPDYAGALMDLIVRAAIRRRDALVAYWNGRVVAFNGMADDSCEMLSCDMYRRQVLPHHRRFYDAGRADSPRGMHLCGDATRHFPTMVSELGVTSFDTGFPVDHGSLRRELGPDVEIGGGVEVATLLEALPGRVYDRTREILLSGIKEGGRFILKEANNLPPNVPEANLAAMYQACLDHGQYDS